MDKKKQTRIEKRFGCCDVDELAKQEGTREFNQYCRGDGKVESKRPETDIKGLYQEHL